MSENLLSSELESTAPRYWRAVDLVEELKMKDIGQKGTTDVEYIDWIQDVLNKGIGGVGLQRNIRDLKNFRPTRDDFGSDIELRVEPKLAEVIALLEHTYREGVRVTIEELNAFLVLHPGILLVGSAEGNVLEELEVAWQDDGVAVLTQEPADLYVDTEKLTAGYIS